MRTVLIRALGAVVVAGAIAAPTAATAGGEETPNRRFCSQFVRYTALREAVDQVRSVVDDSERDDSNRTESFALVALSGPLGKRAAKMARSAPPDARDGFADLAEAYRAGAGVLEEAGVAEFRISALPDEISALTEVAAGDPQPPLLNIVGATGIQDPAAFFDAAGQFTESVQRAEAAAVSELPDDVAEQCGAAPSGEFVCDDLVSDAEAEDVLGGAIDETAAGGGCAWGSDDEVLAVEVYANGDASFDLLEARLFAAEPVADLGDEAATGTGYTSTASGQGGTSGMTMVVRDGRRTLLVSLSLTDTTPEQLTGVAQSVLDNL